ncbi:uncharacterized protein LOC135685462 [Rhopilema esculentum]|uniref:uncharacterized protein LOC135685462 n=1 Tax=Rhopilema esculentum TaxID=499914 RepID=UPI0031DB2DEE
MAGGKQEILYNILGVGIDISNLVLNFSLVYALKKLNKLRIVSYLFIFWLSVSDFLVGATGLLYHIGCILPINSKIAYLLHVPVALFLHCSGYLTITIAIDRCIHMKLLNRYGSFMTIRKSHVILVLNPINAAASLVFKHFFKEIFLSIFLILFFFLCIVYISTYLSIRKNVKKIELHSGLKSTDLSPQHEHRCADLVNDHDNIANVTCTNNVNQLNVLPIQETRLAKQEEKEKKCSARKQDVEIFTISYKESREKAENDCHKAGIKKRDAVEKSHLNSNRDTQKVTITRNRMKRPENEFGKAMIFVLAGFTVAFLPVNVIRLLQMLYPKLVDFSSIRYINLLPNCYASLNAVIFVSFSSDLKRFFQSRII